MEQKPPEITPNTAPPTAEATEPKRPANRLSEGGSGALLRDWGFDPATIREVREEREAAKLKLEDRLRDPEPGSGRELLMSIDQRTAENREHGRGRELRPPWWLDPRYG